MVIRCPRPCGSRRRRSTALRRSKRRGGRRRGGARGVAEGGVHARGRETDWAPAGHVVAWTQLSVAGRASRAAPAPAPVKARKMPPGGNRARERRRTCGCGRADVVWAFDRIRGRLASLDGGGRPVDASAGPRLTFWRAPIDNDRVGYSGGGKAGRSWRDAGLDRLQASNGRDDSTRRMRTARWRSS